MKTLSEIVGMIRARAEGRPAPARAESPTGSYRAPEVIDVGRARDLVAGGSGKHTDGYTGWYWNNEG